MSVGYTESDDTLPSGLAGEPPIEALPLAAQVPSATPGPDVQASLDEFVPPVPTEAPGNIGAPAPLPGVVPEPAPGAPDKGMEIAKAEGEQDKAKAAIESEKADKEAAIAKQNEDDAKLAYADYQDRRAAAQAKLDEKTSAFEKTKLTDPREAVTSKERLSVIFGGLGAAFRSAGGGDASNHALGQLQKKWDDNLDLQKSKIAAAKDQVVMARAGVNDVDEARHELTTAANARTIAQYNAAIKQGESQLKAAGKSQAEIDADKRIESLKVARAAHVVQAQKEADEHALKQAQANALNSRALRDAKKAKGGGAGGGGSLADISQFIKDNPNDQPGAYRLAEKLGYRGAKGTAIVDKLQNDYKKGATGTEGTVDRKLIAHNADGSEAGIATNPRAVAQINKDLRTLPRAIAQLKELRQANGLTMTRRDPRFHNAVLAVASTTSAGSTDANVTHEKGTLTNIFGSPDNDAIDRKIAELENQLAATQNQLDPLPAGYVPLKSGKPAEGEAKPEEKPAEAPAPKAGGKELPGGYKLVKVKDNQTGEVIEAIKHADGTLYDKKTNKRLE